MGCVCHDPRLAGLVCPHPRTTAAGPPGMGATTPVVRGMCAPTPKKGPRLPARARSYVSHLTVASITRRCAEQAGRLGDLAKMDLCDRKGCPLVSGAAGDLAHASISPANMAVKAAASAGR